MLFVNGYIRLIGVGDLTVKADYHAVQSTFNDRFIWKCRQSTSCDCLYFKGKQLLKVDCASFFTEWKSASMEQCLVYDAACTTYKKDQ